MKKCLVVICGPTAVGKTKLGVKLAQRFNGEILSADSRQVYLGMDIGTGKDISEYGKIKIWGLDLADPKEEFDVAQYLREGSGVVANILKRNKLPIVVGGSGFYIKALIEGIETIQIKPNFDFRKELNKLNPQELYEKLYKLDSEKALSMNESDRKNPRRLIRAIEIATNTGTKQLKEQSGFKGESLMIGLKLERKTLNKRIEQRVDMRIKQGVIEEVKKLLSSGISWDDQAMQALGYKQIKDYFDGTLSLNEAVSNWKKEEKKYAKRQMTWFKKDSRIKWFDVAKLDYEQRVEEQVNKWYSQIRIII